MRDGLADHADAMLGALQWEVNEMRIAGPAAERNREKGPVFAPTTLHNAVRSRKNHLWSNEEFFAQTLPQCSCGRLPKRLLREADAAKQICEATIGTHSVEVENLPLRVSNKSQSWLSGGEYPPQTGTVVDRLRWQTHTSDEICKSAIGAEWVP